MRHRGVYTSSTSATLTGGLVFGRMYLPTKARKDRRRRQRRIRPMSKGFDRKIETVETQHSSLHETHRCSYGL